jgi:hypothetical protein
METFNSQLLLQQIQQYQQIQHPMIEELLVLFQQEAALCYQPADYLAHLTATATFSAETADTGPVVVDVNNDFEIFMGNSVIDGVQRRHEYVTMRQKMGEWAYDGEYCDRVYMMKHIEYLYCYTHTIVCLLHKLMISD